MAKTIEEICEDIAEWQKKNHKERSVLLIAGYENKNIQINIKGVKGEVLTCVASAIADSTEIKKLISSALYFANCNTQEEEDN